MSIEKAKKALDEAVYQLKLARIGVGSGPGAAELAAADDLAEKAELSLNAAEKARTSQT